MTAFGTNPAQWLTWGITAQNDAIARQRLAQLIPQIPGLARALHRNEAQLAEMESFYRANGSPPPTLNGKTFAQIRGHHDAAYSLIATASREVVAAAERGKAAGKLREGVDYRIERIGPDDLGAIPLLAVVLILVASAAVGFAAYVYNPSAVASAISQGIAHVLTVQAYLTAWIEAVRTGREPPPTPSNIEHPQADSGLFTVNVPNAGSLAMIGLGLLALYLWKGRK